MNNAGSNFVSLLGGLVAGAAIGVLFAPRSGKETRLLIGEKADEKKEQMNEMIAQGRKEWSTLRGKAADAATMTREEADDLISFIVSEGKDLWSRVSSDTASTASDISTATQIKAEKIKNATHS